MYTVVDEVLEVDAHAPDHLQTSIVDGLSTVLRREAAELSAHEQIQEAHEQATSLSTLIPQYQHARTALFDPTLLERMEITARAALPVDAAEKVLADSAWTHLAGKLAQIEASGADPAERLAAVIEAKGLSDDSSVDSLARVYHYRLGQNLPAGPASLLPPWVTPLPEGERADSEVGQWLVDQAALIRDRVDYLVSEVETEPPAWAAALVPSPVDPGARANYRADLATVVAYRDEHGVTTASSALGSARPGEDSYVAASSALERIRSTTRVDNERGDVDDATKRVLELARRNKEQPNEEQSIRRRREPNEALERMRRLGTDREQDHRGDDPRPEVGRRRGPRI